MKYSYSDWTGKTGTIPVSWKSNDYESLEWQPHHDSLSGYTTEQKNIDIYGDNINMQIPKFEHPGNYIKIPDLVNNIFGYVLNYFDLGDLVYTFNKYCPGMILPWHNDLYPTYSRNKKVKIDQIVRIIVFLHDPEPGHQLWIQDKFCTGPAGSWFSWQGSTKHMAANLGEVDRYIMQITGKI